MSIEFAQSTTLAYHDFQKKLKSDDNVSYLLDEYPEIIDCLRTIPNLSTEEMFKILIAAEKDSFKFSEYLENSKSDSLKLESMLKQKEMELGILRKELKRNSSENSLSNKLLTLRIKLGLPPESKDAFDGIFQKVDSLLDRLRPEKDPHILFTINSDENQELREEIKVLKQKIKDFHEQKKREFKEQENISDNKIDYFQIETLKNQISILLDEKANLFLENEKLKASQKEYEINIIRSRRLNIERKLKYKEIEMRKNIEGLKIELNIMKDDFGILRDLMRDSMKKIFQYQNLDPDFADVLDQKTKALRDTKNLRDTKTNNYMDTKQLIKIMNNTENTHKFTTKRFRSDPLNLDELKQSLDFLSSKHNKEMTQFYNLAKTYFLELNPSFKSQHQAELQLARTKMRALRDEFFDRAEKINELASKIKELSLFKLDIEIKVRKAIEENLQELEYSNKVLRYALGIEKLKHKFKSFGRKIFFELLNPKK